MIVLYFVLGGIYTVLMITAGFLAGYFYRNDKFPESKLINKIKNKLINKEEAGPVKPITKLEREAEEKKGFTDRIKELITD